MLFYPCDEHFIHFLLVYYFIFRKDVAIDAYNLWFLSMSRLVMPHVGLE